MTFRATTGEEGQLFTECTEGKKNLNVDLQRFSMKFYVLQRNTPCKWPESYVTSGDVSVDFVNYPRFGAYYGSCVLPGWVSPMPLTLDEDDS